MKKVTLNVSGYMKLQRFVDLNAVAPTLYNTDWLAVQAVAGYIENQVWNQVRCVKTPLHLVHVAMGANAARGDITKMTSLDMHEDFTVCEVLEVLV